MLNFTVYIMFLYYFYLLHILVPYDLGWGPEKGQGQGMYGNKKN